MAISSLGTDVTQLNVDSDTISAVHNLLAGNGNRIGIMCVGIESPSNLTSATPTWGGNAPTGFVRIEEGSGTENNSVIAWWLEADMPSNGNQTAQCVWSATGETSMHFGVIQDALQQAPTTNSDNGAGQSSTTASISTNAGDWAICSLSLGDGNTVSWSNGETELVNNSDAGGSSQFAAARFDPAAGTETAMGATYSSANRTAFATAVFAAEPTVSYEQEGYRFRNDDGSESAATWKANQDTNVTVAKSTNFRVRVLTDTTGNAGSVTRTLQYRLVGDPDSEWETVS